MFLLNLYIYNSASIYCIYQSLLSLSMFLLYQSLLYVTISIELSLSLSIVLCCIHLSVPTSSLSYYLSIYLLFYVVYIYRFVSFSKFNWNNWFYSSTVMYRLHLKTPKYNPFSSQPPWLCWYISLSYSTWLELLALLFSPKTWAARFWNFPKTWAPGYWNLPKTCSS